MHEICRNYFDWKDRRFLIIIFTHENEEQVKIFLHRQLVYQQAVKSGADDHHIKTIGECSEWIKNKYT